MFLAKRIASALLLLASFGLAVRPPTVLLHLSDIHLSTNVQKYWRAFGDREGDLELFAGKLLAQLAPQGVLLSGDLTDSKDAAGAGLQQEAEWQAYRRILDAFVAAGVPESLIFDLRGNHDVFNMALRGGPNDFCRTYSAEGRRCPVSQRVFSAVLPAPRQPQHAGPAEAAGTVNSRRLAESLGSGGQADSETQEERCPQVAILGVDPTPEPGLRSPANFGGVASKALLDALKAELQGLRKSPPQGCPPPLVVSQGHYPLSTMDAPTQVTGPLSLLRHLSRSAQSMQLVAQVLAEHNVSAYLTGHLHGAFGQRLHRLHATPAGGYLAELETAAWKDDRRFRLVALDRWALTFADLFFHAPGTPRRPRRKEDGLAVKENAWLEAYQQRGYAVTPADPSAEVLHHIALITWPPDARYSPLAPSNPQQQQGQQAQQASASREAGRRLADGTGGATEEPVGAGSSSSNSSRALDGVTSEAQEGDVRAMVFSLDPRAAAHPEQWQVTLHTWLPGGAAFSPPLRMLLQPAGGDLAGGPQLFSASLAVDLNCSSASSSSGSRLKAWWEGGSSAAGKSAEGGCAPPADHIFAQVEVRGGDGHVSSSPTQPTALHCRPLPLTAVQGGALSAHRMQRCVAAVPAAPLPLGTSWLERLILAVNWPVVVHRLFIFLWVCHVGLLLLLPRMLCSRWAPRISASPLFRPQSTALLSTTAAAPAVPTIAPPTSRTPSQWQPVGQSATGRAAAASLKTAKRWAAAAPQALGGFLLWPAAALVLLPCEMGTWMALVAYMCYLLVGPWYVAELLSGYPRAVLFHAGVLAKLPAVAESGSGSSSPASSWRFIGTSDVFVMSLVHLMFCVFPMTLWVACVVGRRQLALKQSLPDRPSRRSSSSTVRVGIDGSSSSSDSSASAPVGKECGSSQGGVGLWVKLQQFTVLQLLALACVAALNVVGAYDKAAKMNGWMSVVLSPGFAWTIPLAVLPVLWPPLSKQALCLGKGD